jgi:hypothetical protein
MKAFKSNQLKHRDEQGMVMILALFMGLILTAGISGMMMSQLTARRNGAAKSFQEMAENAAINGFNRILGEANRDTDQNYKGFFLTLDNDEGKWNWRNPNTLENPLVELCTYTGVSMTASPLGDSTEPEPVQLTSKVNDIKSERIDNKEEIQVWYRLRGYALTGDGDSDDEGTFEIEGIVARKNRNIEKDYLARALLTRSLYIDQRVAGYGDWAVLGGYFMRLGDIQIKGKGKVLLDVDEPEQFLGDDGCYDTELVDSVGASNASLASRIWPVLNRGLPLLNLFERGKGEDTMAQSSNTDKVRVWNFDDSGSEEMAERCGENVIACVRQEDELTFKLPEGVDQSQSTIIIKQDDICINTDSFECHLFVEHINLESTKILIETGTDAKPRPIVIHLERPNTTSLQSNYSNGNITLRGSSIFCGANNGESSCNGNPERFVIAAREGTDSRSCDNNVHSLDFTGKTLPDAFILLRKGTVRTSQDAELHGIIWAQNICTKNGSFTLKTDNTDGTVIEAADNLWGWSDNKFPGYGQMVVRGIRGKGFDKFRLW